MANSEAGRPAATVNQAPVSIAVIVPCYNAGAYLGEALESACSQSPAPMEVIVIDDGSTDDSASIAEHFGSPVRCVRQPHRGAGAARNAGMAMARAALIAFLDADDLWTSGGLACRLDALNAEPALGYVSGLVEQFVSPELPDEIRRSFACPPGTSNARALGTMLLRRETIDRVGLLDETLRVAEGLDWVARADEAGVPTRVVDQVVLRRRIHGANTGAQNHHLRLDYLRMLKKSLDRRRAPDVGDQVAVLPPSVDDA